MHGQFEIKFMSETIKLGFLDIFKSNSKSLFFNFKNQFIIILTARQLMNPFFLPHFFFFFSLSGTLFLLFTYFVWKLVLHTTCGFQDRSAWDMSTMFLA